MSDPNKLRDRKPPYPTTIAPIPIWIGDREVYLQYTLEVVQRMKTHFGKAMLGLNAGLLELDEEMLPQVIVLGLCDEDGGKPEDLPTEDDIKRLPAAAYKYLMESFNHAWNGSMPKKKQDRLEAQEANDPATDLPN